MIYTDRWAVTHEASGNGWGIRSTTDSVTLTRDGSWIVVEFTRNSRVREAEASNGTGVLVHIAYKSTGKLAAVLDLIKE